MFEKFFLAVIFTLSLYLFLQTNQSGAKPNLLGERLSTPSSMIIAKSIINKNITNPTN